MDLWVWYVLGVAATSLGVYDRGDRGVALAMVGLMGLLWPVVVPSYAVRALRVLSAKALES